MSSASVPDRQKLCSNQCGRPPGNESCFQGEDVSCVQNPPFSPFTINSSAIDPGHIIMIGDGSAYHNQGTDILRVQQYMQRTHPQKGGGAADDHGLRGQRWQEGHTNHRKSVFSFFLPAGGRPRTIVSSSVSAGIVYCCTTHGVPPPSTYFAAGLVSLTVSCGCPPVAAVAAAQCCSILQAAASLWGLCSGGTYFDMYIKRSSLLHASTYI